MTPSWPPRDGWVLRRMAIGGAAVWATPMMTRGLGSGPAPAVAPASSTGTRSHGRLFHQPDHSATPRHAGDLGVSQRTRHLDRRQRSDLGWSRRGHHRKHLRFAMSRPMALQQRDPPDDHVLLQQPGDNVAFTFFDIDNQTGNGWGDRITMITTGYTFTPAFTTRRHHVIGNGTNTWQHQHHGRFRNLSEQQPRRHRQPRQRHHPVRRAPHVVLVHLPQRGEHGSRQLISMSDITFTC